MTANRYEVYFEGNENVLKLDCSDDDDCVTVNILKSLNCTFYKGEFYGM